MSDDDIDLREEIKITAALVFTLTPSDVRKGAPRIRKFLEAGRRFAEENDDPELGERIQRAGSWLNTLESGAKGENPDGARKL